ncbi:MAG TPA: 2-oxoacid:acceptor oxidoreductase family protein [Clostridia bacterium]|nr:2-oxoacid:acceptor oxidoreductase family protein [Clostridia bacterium]HOR12737.1 2-oxoacid:acceptor oxidoreductase family protein [Clostridia bacterium]
MLEQNLFAGFGGQGVLLMGQLLAFAGMLESKYVSWLPAYGPEMRGGTANCSVNISDEPIGSPVVSKATSVIVMNRPSLDKFESAVQPGGMLFINSSIIDRKAERDDIQVFYVPCNEIAEQLGNARVANVVMLGAYIEKTKCVDMENILNALLEKLGKTKAHLIPLNREALVKGAESVR